MLILYSIACYMPVLTRMLVSNPLLYFYCLDHHSQPCIVDFPNKTCHRLGNKHGFLIIVVLEFESEWTYFYCYLQWIVFPWHEGPHLPVSVLRSVIQPLGRSRRARTRCSRSNKTTSVTRIKVPPGALWCENVEFFHGSMGISGSDWLEVPTLCKAYVREYTHKMTIEWGWILMM